MDIKRSNLKQFYKFIKICKLPSCRLPYGIDNLNSETNKDICPVCTGKIHRLSFIETVKK